MCTQCCSSIVLQVLLYSLKHESVFFFCFFFNSAAVKCQLCLADLQAKALFSAT